jgi:hypothetical protein
MLEIEDASIVNGYIDTVGHLILITHGGEERDAGPISLFVATEDAIGSVELATPAETLAGTDTSRAITPAGLEASLNDKISALPGLTFLQTMRYTSSSTFNKASFPGIKAVRVRVIGAGGGGGGAPTANTGNHSAGGGGGGGGYAEEIVLAVSLGVSETVTVGAGGAAGTPSVVALTGGTSSFGAHAVATGGAPGQSFGDNSLMLAAHGGAGGIGITGSMLVRGGPGSFGTGHATLGISGAGGSSNLGGGGVGVYGPGGSSSIAGVAGGNFGGGGGGAAVNALGSGVNGGAGAPGIVIVEVYV